MKKVYLNTLTPEDIIKRLKDGEVIWHTNNVFNYKFVDGVLCSFRQNKMITINCGFDAKLDDAYFEEQEEFKVEKTGRYKTRDGRIAYVSYIGDEYISGIIDGDVVATAWRTDGTFCGKNKIDLVEYVGD